MTHERRVLVHRDRAAVAGAVAARFVTEIIDVLDGEDAAHVMLTGGTVATTVLTTIRELPARDSVDWARVHFWWGDERWVTKSDPERNDGQAQTALLDHIDVPAENIHAFPAPDEVANLDTAAAAYSVELTAHAPFGRSVPRFDIAFLGVGQDGHVASLFPHHAEIKSDAIGVLAVRNSPKPPLNRLTLSLATINSSERVWLVVAGVDKVCALGRTFAGASINEVPAAGVLGREQTVFFVDRDAATEVPEALIAPRY